MKRPLSTLGRREIIEDMESATFDLLIIGGGITGAGIAWDAAKRGLKTALIERADFSSGTSSRSTKLIHGGLRYLKKGEVRLVREVGRERELLHRSAPHLVIPMRMLLPLYKGGSFGYLSASFGLSVYDRLAGVDKEERRVMHRADETIRQEPLLTRNGLKGGGLYYEYRSDDARLTMEVLKTAVRHGAWVLNYMEADGFLYYKSKVCGIKAVDRLSGAEVEIRAKRIVNAAGPWVDEIRAKDHALRGKQLLLTKGVHLVVDHSRLPVRQAAYFDTPDGRMVFVIPRDGKTYIGTTDTVYRGDLGKPRVTVADRDYLLSAVEHVFPHTDLHAEDVESMWAGLRPLIHEEGKNPSDVSRKDEIWESTSGLITIAGGKLTGFRKMAEKTVDLICRGLEREARHAFGPCTTDKEALSGGDSGRCETYEELREQLLLLGIKKGLSLKTANYLLALYGSNTSDIYMRMDGLDNRFDEWQREQEEASADRLKELLAETVDAQWEQPPHEPDGQGASHLESEPDIEAVEVPEATQELLPEQDAMRMPEANPAPVYRKEPQLDDVEQWKPGIMMEPQSDKLSEAWRLLEKLSGKSEESWRKRNRAASAEQAAELPVDPAERWRGDGEFSADWSEELPPERDKLISIKPEPSSAQAEQPHPVGEEEKRHLSGDGLEQREPQELDWQQVSRLFQVQSPIDDQAELEGRDPYNSEQAAEFGDAYYDQEEQTDAENEAIPLEHNEYAALEAEIRYCIDEEMIVHAADFLVRRTGLLYFDRERAERIAVYVIDIMAQHLGWDEAEIMKQKIMLAQEWEAATVAVKTD